MPRCPHCDKHCNSEGGLSNHLNACKIKREKQARDIERIIKAVECKSTPQIVNNIYAPGGVVQVGCVNNTTIINKAITVRNTITNEFHRRVVTKYNHYKSSDDIQQIVKKCMVETRDELICEDSQLGELIRGFVTKVVDIGDIDDIDDVTDKQLGDILSDTDGYIINKLAAEFVDPIQRNIFIKNNTGTVFSA